MENLTFTTTINNVCWAKSIRENIGLKTRQAQNIVGIKVNICSIIEQMCNRN
jgi:hypothetical protein